MRFIYIYMDLMFSVFGRLNQNNQQFFLNIYFGVKSCFWNFCWLQIWIHCRIPTLTQGSCDLLLLFFFFFWGVKFHQNVKKYK
jgi:hypothetical protein